MAKVNQSEIVEVKELANAFKIRYNREVKVFRSLTISENKIKVASIRIVSPKGINYTITEHLTDDGLTDFATVDLKDKQYRYKTFLEAEVFIADKMGEE